jgi:hypothetical protein
MDNNKKKNEIDDIFQFLTMVAETLSKQPAQTPQRTVNNTRITVIIQPPSKGWFRTQLGKLW